MQLAERSARLKDLLALTESIADHLLAGNFLQAQQIETDRQKLAREIFREPVSRGDAGQVRTLLQSIVDADHRLRSEAESLRATAGSDLAQMNRGRQATAAFLAHSQ